MVEDKSRITTIKINRREVDTLNNLKVDPYLLKYRLLSYDHVVRFLIYFYKKNRDKFFSELKPKENSPE